jgi:hypothetical protein
MNLKTMFRAVLGAGLLSLLPLGPALAQQGPFVSVSAKTSATPGTATQLIPALNGPTGRRKLVIRNEGIAVVCFSAFTQSPSAGAPGTFCLKGGTEAGDGTGGTYATQPEMSDPNAVWMVSGTASVPITAWVQ